MENVIAEVPAGRTDTNWIQTYTGKQFWPHDARPEEIDIVDIAHALSMKCRFTGHCIQFYSVAQHSVLVSRLVPERDALHALLHDATEAYLPDVARPIKPLLQNFTEIEDRLWLVIAARFGLDPVLPASVKHADLIALRTERRDLMSPPPRPWRTDELCDAAVETITPTGPFGSELAFLQRYTELLHALHSGRFEANTGGGLP